MIYVSIGSNLVKNNLDDYTLQFIASNMKFLEQLNIDLEQYHLLNHLFYQSWNMGKLSHFTLQTYVKEYYHHVADFPRYISAIHSNMAISRRYKCNVSII